MKSIMIKNKERLVQRKGILMMFLLMIIASVSFTLYSHNIQTPLATIAYVGNRDIIFPESVRVVKVNETPEFADLVMNKYDAIVYEDMSIDSIKSTAFIESLESALNFDVINIQDTDLGLTLIKMITMFLFMMVNFLMFTLGDDFELMLFDRIIKSPLSSFKYLISNLLFTSGVASALTMIVLICVRLLGFSIGYSLLKYFILIFMITFLASSLSAIFYIFFKKVDTASMFSQITVIMTSLLSGSFNLLSEQTDTLKFLTSVLPQKLLFLALEDSKPLNINYAYVMIWIIVCVSISYAMMRKYDH